MLPNPLVSQPESSTHSSGEDPVVVCDKLPIKPCHRSTTLIGLPLGSSTTTRPRAADPERAWIEPLPWPTVKALRLQNYPLLPKPAPIPQCTLCPSYTPPSLPNNWSSKDRYCCICAGRIAPLLSTWSISAHILFILRCLARLDCRCHGLIFLEISCRLWQCLGDQVRHHSSKH